VALLNQHALGGGPKTLGNAAPVDVVVPPVVGGPEQGRPVNGFVPVDRLGTLGAGETGASRPAATVFPLIIGLTVFPLSSGLLVFCAICQVQSAHSSVIAFRWPNGWPDRICDCRNCRFLLVGVAGFEPATPSSRTRERGVRVEVKSLFRFKASVSLSVVVGYSLD
jgi:hypothetical protein